MHKQNENKSQDYNEQPSVYIRSLYFEGNGYENRNLRLKIRELEIYNEQLKKVTSKTINENQQLFDEIDKKNDEIRKKGWEYLESYSKYYKESLKNYHLTDEIGRLKQELKDAKSELEKTTKELNELKENHENTKKEAEHKDKKIKEQEEELNQTKLELNETNKTNKNQTVEINELKEKLQNKENELNNAKSELEKTTKELNELKENHEKNLEDLESKTNKISALEKSVKEQSKMFLLVSANTNVTARKLSLIYFFAWALSWLSTGCKSYVDRIRTIRNLNQEFNALRENLDLQSTGVDFIENDENKLINSNATGENIEDNIFNILDNFLPQLEGELFDKYACIYWNMLHLYNHNTNKIYNALQETHIQIPSFRMLKSKIELKIHKNLQTNKNKDTKLTDLFSDNIKMDTCRQIFNNKN